MGYAYSNMNTYAILLIILIPKIYIVIINTILSIYEILALYKAMTYNFI